MVVRGSVRGWLTSLSISHLCIFGEGRVCLLAYNIVKKLVKWLLLLVWLGYDD